VARHAPIIQQSIPAAGNELIELLSQVGLKLQ
jgi:hypothetical protein